jgi:hypothetical protein
MHLSQLGSCAWGGFLRGESSFGREISGGNVTLGVLTELLYVILFDCFTFSLPNFYMDMFRGKYPGAFSVRFVLWGIVSTEGGISGVTEKPIHRLKSYSNKNC